MTGWSACSAKWFKSPTGEIHLSTARSPSSKNTISTDSTFTGCTQVNNLKIKQITSILSSTNCLSFNGFLCVLGDKDDKEKELLTTLLYELREKFSSYGYLLSTVLPPFRYFTYHNFMAVVLLLFLCESLLQNIIYLPKLFSPSKTKVV